MYFAEFYVVHLVEVSLTKGLSSSRSEHGLDCRRWSRKKKYSEVVIQCGGTVAVAECGPRPRLRVLERLRQNTQRFQIFKYSFLRESLFSNTSTTMTACRSNRE